MEVCCPYPYLGLNLPNDVDCANSVCANYSILPSAFGGDNKRICCIWKCILTNSGYLIFSTDPNIAPQTNVNGLIDVFLNSRNYDPAWEPIVRTSTVKCYDDAEGMNIGKYCDDLSDSFRYSVICSMRDFFLRCPDQFWNPKKWDHCEKVYRPWVLECLDTYLIGVN